jgi:hypothetical protein
VQNDDCRIHSINETQITYLGSGRSEGGSRANKKGGDDSRELHGGSGDSVYEKIKQKAPNVTSKR